jgi:dynein heavy chain 1, cytosolic
MEVLMKEGAQVEEQISHSEEVMKQVRNVVSRFEPFAGLCREIFVLLESLRSISYLYEFPAKTFMMILENILESSTIVQEVDEGLRIEALKKALFEQLAARVGRGLLHEDKIVFVTMLGRLKSRNKSFGASEVQTTEELIEQCLEVFGQEFPWQGRAFSDLTEVCEHEICSTVPLLLCCSPGHDVSSRVEGLARELNKDLSAIAMGSSEGFDTAESLVATASKRGTWVLLKNVHLCTDWLRETLVKKVNSLGPGTHKDFRLFITSEINPRLPTALLRLSDKMVCQAPTGIGAFLSRLFSSIPKDRFSSPVRSRLYLLLAWTHAVIQERLRFVPNGWSEAYEWSEADAIHGLDVIDSLLDDGGRQVSDPERLPWEAIRSTLCKGVFGGRITHEVDQKVLDDLVNALFVPNSFNVDFRLVLGVTESPSMPDGSSREAVKDWIASLPSRTPPTWIGLDSSAEMEREKRMADDVVRKVVAIQQKCSQEN